jgi:hypothetical protein
VAGHIVDESEFLMPGGLNGEKRPAVGVRLRGGKTGARRSVKHRGSERVSPP